MAEGGDVNAAGSGKGGMAAVLLVALLGAAAGAGFTMAFVAPAPTIEDRDPPALNASEDSKAAKSAKPGDAAAKGSRIEAKKDQQTDHIIGLDPILVTLAGPQKSWARVELSMVTEGGARDDFALLSKTISEDLMSFLRTVPLSHVESAVGLEYLREDLSEIARLRSKGRVRDVLLRSLVVE
jgi:flagellar protein FliL